MRCDDMGLLGPGYDRQLVVFGVRWGRTLSLTVVPTVSAASLSASYALRMLVVARSEYRGTLQRRYDGTIYSQKESTLFVRRL